MNALSKIRLISGSLMLVIGLLGCTGYSPYSLHSTKNSGDESASGTLTEITPITPALVKAQQEQRELEVGQDIKHLITGPTQYLIGPGDVLSIVVWDHPEFSSTAIAPSVSGATGTDPAAATSAAASFVVDHDGMVQFPYAGKLKLISMTEEQARSLVTNRLARYINKPNVTLRVQAFRSKRIYIDGEVKFPGVQAINDIPMTLMEGINRAGGILPTGDQSQIVVNRAGTTYKINLLRMVQKSVTPDSIMLMDGDVIRVLSRDESRVFVSGEVTTPKSMIMHNGRLTLNEALGDSGGINPITGDGRQVYVVRKSGKTPIVYRLDASTPEAFATAEEFELNPRDVVFVSASALANWNRSISLLFPSSFSSLTGPVR